MTRDKALSEARKRWGKKAIIQANESLSSPDRRSMADDGFQIAKARIDAIDTEIEARLDALDWYQALIIERKTMVAQKQQTMWARSYRKFEVGHDSMGIAFHVCGQGDTWEEAFANADERIENDLTARKR